MSLSFGSAISGIRAAFSALDVSAHNIANVNTEGFKKQRAIVTEGNNGEVVTKIDKKDTRNGSAYQTTSQDTIDTSNVDITQEIAEQIGDKHLSSVNIAAFKVFDDVQKGLIDIMG